jgi:hypothetical protein
LKEYFEFRFDEEFALSNLPDDCGTVSKGFLLRLFAFTENYFNVEGVGRAGQGVGVNLGLRVMQIDGLDGRDGRADQIDLIGRMD